VNDTTSSFALDERFHFLIAHSIDCVAARDTIEDIKARMDRVLSPSLPEVSPLERLLHDLDFYEHNFVVAGIDDIVFNAFQSGITLPGMQLGNTVARFGFKQQFPAGLRNDNVVMSMDMPACLGSRCESPLGDYRAIV
jgi:hypothetical protein